MENKRSQFLNGWRRFWLLIIVMKVSLITVVSGQDDPVLRVDRVSTEALSGYLNIEVSSDEAGSYEVEASSDMVDWEHYPLYLAKFTGEEEEPRSLQLPNSSSDFRFYRFTPRENSEIQVTLDRNQAKWNALGIETYQYVTRESCFCLPEDTREVRVSVLDGEIESVVVVETGELVETAKYSTINELFGRVQEAVDRPADVVNVEYDPIYGYPIWGYFDWSLGVVDEERGFSAELLRTEVQVSLDQNREKWNAFGVETYQYVTRDICFCAPSDTRKVRVSVENGEISSVMVVETGEFIETGRYTTIEGLFGRVQEAVDRPADVVNVEYDPNYGYPTLGYVDWSLGVVDEEIGFSAQLLGFVNISDTVLQGESEDMFEIKEVELDGSTLRAIVNYGGGCESHQFSLAMTPAGFLESNPVQANLYLRHDNGGDTCEANVTHGIEFDVSAIVSLYKEMYQDDGAIRLNIHSVIDGVEQLEADLLLQP